MKTTKLKHNYTGKSLLELREEYGTGESGFWETNKWWLDEPFAKEKLKAGMNEINFEKKITNLTYQEQEKWLKKGWEMPHPTILAEAILEHYKKTGERLLEDWWSRTCLTASDGFHISLGYFDSNGLSVHRSSDGSCGSDLGVSALRKIENSEEKRKIITTKLSNKQIDKLTEIVNAHPENMPTKLSIIIHNQGIINDKLNKLLG